MLDFFIQIDREVFLFLNSLNSGLFDSLMYFISGTKTWFPFYLFLLFLIYKQNGWSGLLAVVVVIALLITFADRGSVYIKDLTMRSRPCLELPLLGYEVHTVRDMCFQSWGFVSSHAANTFALAVFLTLLFRTRYKYITPVLFTYAALNSYSRVYLGLHYPGDIVFGALFGVALGFIVFFLWRKISPCSACMA